MFANHLFYISSKFASLLSIWQPILNFLTIIFVCLFSTPNLNYSEISEHFLEQLFHIAKRVWGWKTRVLYLGFMKGKRASLRDAARVLRIARYFIFFNFVCFVTIVPWGNIGKYFFLFCWQHRALQLVFIKADTVSGILSNCGCKNCMLLNFSNNINYICLY